MFEQKVNLGPGTGTFADHTLEILLMLLGALLLGLWLGWILWNRYKQTADKLRTENESLMATLNATNTEFGGMKTKLTASETSNIGLRAELDKLKEENRILRDQVSETGHGLAETEQRNRQLETELGLSQTPETPTPDDIPLEINTMVEKTAETPAVKTTVNVIVETPPPVEMIAETPIVEAPTTPPVEEKPQEVVEPAAKAEISTPPPPIVAIPIAREKDDLTVIEGIGPKIQELLSQYDINTYNQLAETEVNRLKEILLEAGPQLAMHDPGTWPSQANLAANDQWEALKSIQGFLKGGKKPT